MNTHRRHHLQGFFIAVALVCAAGLSTVFAEYPDFAARKARILEVAAGESEYNLFTIAAKLRTGRDLPQAYQMIDSMVHDRAMGGMFYSYTMIGLYLFTRDLLPDSIVQKIRRAYRDRTMYRGDTENHWVMYYTGLYLASCITPVCISHRRHGHTNPAAPGSTGEVPGKTLRNPANGLSAG